MPASVHSVRSSSRTYIGRCVILDYVLGVRFVRACGDVRQRIAPIIYCRFYRNNIFSYRR